MLTRRLARLLVQQHKQLVDSRASVAIAVQVPVDQRLALGLLARALSALWATVRARAGRVNGDVLAAGDTQRGRAIGSKRGACGR